MLVDVVDFAADPFQFPASRLFASRLKLLTDVAAQGLEIAAKGVGLALKLATGLLPFAAPGEGWKDQAQQHAGPDAEDEYPGVFDHRNCSVVVDGCSLTIRW